MDSEYPNQGEKVMLSARVVNIHKHDIPAHRQITVQLSDGQGVTTNPANIARTQTRPSVEHKVVVSAPETTTLTGPMTSRRR